MKELSKKILAKIGVLNYIQSITNFVRRHKRKIYNNYFATARILLYHRVSNTASDPHLLSVSPENFRAQLTYLSAHFNLISLYEMVNKIQKNNVDANDVVITFDDGYADNLYNALPILEELNIPATIFVTAGKIGSKQPFFWDIIVDERDRGRPLTHPELRKLSNSNLIEIGAHTMSHVHLRDCSIEIQNKEIKKSKKILENLINKKVISFAYPFGWSGDYSSETVRLVKDAGYMYACAVEAMRISNSTNLYTIPRFVVRDWGLEEFVDNFNNFV